MSILIYSLLIAALLPYITKLPLAYAMHQIDGYDNKHPREQQARLEGFGARALAAHQNAFESLIIFAAAITTALATNHTESLIQNLALIHIAARILYPIFYMMNWDILRSTIWTVGLFSSIAIILNCLPVV